MNRFAPLFIAVFVLFAASVCQADTLVITYRSGKTQTVVLDEPSQGINSWQFVAGSVPQQQSIKQDDLPVPAKQIQVQKDQKTQSQTDINAVEKAPEKKSNIRVNWNAKPIPD